MSDLREPIVFQPFRPGKTVRIYYRNLPHWRQEGCAYFVTFRTADSIPRSVMSKWMKEDEAWFSAHGMQSAFEPAWYDKIPERERQAFEKRRANRLHVELDACHGACLLRDTRARRIAEEALCYFEGERCACGDFVIMPNHVHWLVVPLGGYELEELLESVKKFSSGRLTKAELKEGRFWQKENYDHIVRNEEELNAFRRYIADNPAKARLGDSAFTLVTREWLCT